MSGVFELLVTVFEGRNFPRGESFRLLGSFNDEYKTTSLSKPTSTPNWSEQFEWRLDAERMRKVTSSGVSQVKLSVARHDGWKLGWIVLDLRTAKMNATRTGDQPKGGVWLPIAGTGTKIPKGNLPPALRVHYVLREVTTQGESIEDEVAKFMEGKLGSSTTAAVDASVLEPEEKYEDDFDGDETALLESAAADPDAKDEDASKPQVAPLSPQAAVPPEQPRFFKLGIDVRTFRSTRKIPLAVSNVYVKVHLPPELKDIMQEGGCAASTLLAPLKTSPPIEVNRGTEVALPNGFVALEFTATVITLAKTLIGPTGQLLAEVWHRDRYKADSMIGLASIGLSPLLKEPYLDGFARVEALAPSKTGPQTEKVSVGALRVVVCLEEFGEVPTTSPKKGPPVFPEKHPTTVLSLNPVAAASAGAEASTAGPASAEVEAADPGSGSAAAPAVSGGVAGGGGSAARGAGAEERKVAEAGAAESGSTAGFHVRDSAEIREGAEYKTAWELEMWKQSETAKWRAEMKEREAARMAELEAEWRRREKQRESEHRILKEEAAIVEGRLKTILAQTEDRERKLVAAEEALALKKDSMERDMAGRMTEAQTAVRRLQEECEHQLEMERSKVVEGARLRHQLEERLLASDARAERLEHQFHLARQEHRATPEAALQTEVAQLQGLKLMAERRADAALRAKSKYKEQVRQLARKLASLQRQLQDTEARHARATQVYKATQEAELQITKLKAERRELKELTEQLVSSTGTKAAAAAQPPPPGPAPAWGPMGMLGFPGGPLMPMPGYGWGQVPQQGSPAGGGPQGAGPGGPPAGEGTAGCGDEGGQDGGKERTAAASKAGGKGGKRRAMKDHVMGIDVELSSSEDEAEERGGASRLGSALGGSPR